MHVTSANVGKDSLKQNLFEWRQMVWVPDKWTRFAKQGSGTPSIEFSRSSCPVLCTMTKTKTQTILLLLISFINVCIHIPLREIL